MQESWLGGEVYKDFGEKGKEMFWNSNGVKGSGTEK